MRSCLALVFIFILVFSFFPVNANSSQQSLKYSIPTKDKVASFTYLSGPSEIEEFYRTTLTGYYDAVIYPKDSSKKSIKQAIKEAKEEFKDSLAGLCEEYGVKFKILSISGPDQIDYKERLSFTVSLSGENKAINQVDMLMQNKYEDPPKDDSDNFYF